MESVFDKFITAGFRPPQSPRRVRDEYSVQYHSLLPSDPQAEILDLGCGTGDFLAFLESRGYRRAIGADVSREMVEFARTRTACRVDHVEDEIEYLTPQAGRFRLVTMNNVIEHIPKQMIIPVLAAVRSSLEPGGRIVVKTGNTATLSGMYLRFKDFTHEVGFTEYSLRQVLTIAGFGDVSVKGNPMVFRWTLKRMARIMALRVVRLAYRIAYAVEYGNEGPTIFSRLLIAVGTKED